MTARARETITAWLRAIAPRIWTPRLLPMTIVVLALALTWRSAALVRSAIAGIQPAPWITVARASGTEPPSGGSAHAEKQRAKPEPAAEPARTEEKLPAQNGSPPVTDGERAILLELRQRRQELEAREATLASRESMLAAAEKKLSARVGELQSLQLRLESLDASHRQQEDAAWQGLVKVYETMKPRDAAAIFNDLGMPVLLAVVGRMKEAKAAAVLAAMSPDKARDVTTQLALSRTQATDTVQTGGKPALAPAPGKPPGSGT